MIFILIIETGIQCVNYLWYHAKYIHHIDFAIYLLFLAFETVAIYAFYIPDRADLKLFSYAASFVTFIMILYFWYREIKQFNQRSKTESQYEARKKSKKQNCLVSYLDHIKDIWNLFDLLSYLTLIAGFLVRFLKGEETDVSRGILAFASVVTWSKLLYFLRPFPKSGKCI